ncbi:MAG: DUF4450 domain-containing protein [Verrucomicrobia bacterium]|nr:DUF4450 domain-containing protein [Verrucomicrobiota bacterium]
MNTNKHEFICLRVHWCAFVVALISGWPSRSHAQAPGALRVTPNLESNIDRPLRYRPDGTDFVIANGAETFNRPLYGGNTAFRVDGGDKPEFVLYLPGRGGNLRLGMHRAAGTKWLHAAAKIETRYRPGELLYEIRDPLLGADGVLRLAVLAYHQTEGVIVRVELGGSGRGDEAGPERSTRAGASLVTSAATLELVFAYGGINGQRGARDGDIGTERVPISEWFQLKPEFCRDNAIELRDGDFTLTARAATIVGLAPAGTRLRVADAAQWSDPAALLTAQYFAAPQLPVVVGRAPLVSGHPAFLSLQRVTATTAAAEELDTYKAVTADRPGVNRPAPRFKLAPAFATADLPRLFDETETHFAALRSRVSVDTPDPFLNAAVGALNVAADAVWDEPQEAIMHGAIAWRSKLLGWRGPYALDALGWHERARKHFEYWATRQNQDPIPEKLPPPDENTNLARSEKALHSNGDMSNSHYDMNLVYIDALFRHLRWTGDVEFAKKMWPVIERHLAWERRMFRREFTVGAEKLPLYEAYAAIWASDDLQYSGGGTAHASAYNFFHNQETARLAPLVGADPTSYAREAELIARAMRELLWVRGEGRSGFTPDMSGVNPDLQAGWFAECKDWLGLQRVHPAAAVWSFYHTMDSGLPTPQEAWQMTRQIDTQVPHIPVRGPGVPEGLHTVASSNWLPYSWSINNVVMGEALHTALGFWQAGRADEAWRIAKGSLTAAMFMGISPGNVGSMSYLDVYRRESQRDFADGSGVTSRAIVEGLFGVKPDALAGELRVEPGWPWQWTHARLGHPDIDFSFRRDATTLRYIVTPRLARPVALRLRVPVFGATARVTINGREVSPRLRRGTERRLEIESAPAERHDIVVVWQGTPSGDAVPGEPRVTWPPAKAAASGARRVAVAASETIDLAGRFNDRVTQIFKNEYRAPRSPFVSLALPKQGIGAWAGHVNETAEIDDTGLRALATKGGGKFALPNGTEFATPGETGAKNVIFVSQWDNYPREATVALAGRAGGVALLMAGSTHHMQSRFDNGEVIVAYADGTIARLALRNPETWWPIEQDYFIDDFQFRTEGSLPVRVDLKTGDVRVLERETFKGRGGKIPGGAATVLELSLDPTRELKSLTVRALANDVVIGLMAATLAR